MYIWGTKIKFCTRTKIKHFHSSLLGPVAELGRAGGYNFKKNPTFPSRPPPPTKKIPEFGKLKITLKKKEGNYREKNQLQSQYFEYRYDFRFFWSSPPLSPSVISAKFHSNVMSFKINGQLFEKPWEQNWIKQVPFFRFQNTVSHRDSWMKTRTRKKWLRYTIPKNTDI